MFDIEFEYEEDVQGKTILDSLDTAFEVMSSKKRSILTKAVNIIAQYYTIYKVKITITDDKNYIIVYVYSYSKNRKRWEFYINEVAKHEEEEFIGYCHLENGEDLRYTDMKILPQSYRLEEE